MASVCLVPAAAEFLVLETKAHARVQVGVKCSFTVLRKANHFILVFCSHIKSTSDLKGSNYLFYKFIKVLSNI